MKDQIESIWILVLGHSLFDRNDSFFDVGGHSLNANLLVKKLNESFDASLSVRDIFENESVNKQASKVASMRITK